MSHNVKPRLVPPPTQKVQNVFNRFEVVPIANTPRQRGSYTWGQLWRDSGSVTLIWRWPARWRPHSSRRVYFTWMLQMRWINWRGHHDWTISKCRALYNLGGCCILLTRGKCSYRDPALLSKRRALRRGVINPPLTLYCILYIYIYLYTYIYIYHQQLTDNTWQQRCAFPASKDSFLARMEAVAVRRSFR